MKRRGAIEVLGELSNSRRGNEQMDTNILCTDGASIPKAVEELCAL